MERRRREWIRLCRVWLYVLNDENNTFSYIKYLRRILAEGVGFEPTVPLQARRFSRPVP
jgi:hypothetical protein